MPYTIGASHGPFTGLGSFVISKPAGVRTVLSGIPSWAARDTSSPVRYFRIGRYTLGNIDGFQNSVPIEYAQQVAYPIAQDWEILAYDIRDGASCLFQELVEVAVAAKVDPWDRAPSHVILGNTLQLIGGTGATTAWTYTVPGARKLFVAHAQLKLRRITAASAVLTTSLTMKVNGVEMMRVPLFTNIAGQETGEEMHGGPMVFLPGTVILVEGSNSDTGGDVRGTSHLAGMLFDA